MRTLNPHIGTDLSRRLDVLLRGCGALSKRETREYAAVGRITVNGETVTDASFRVEPGDEVCIDGKAVAHRESVTLMMNKPSGYACVQGGTPYPTVFSLLGDGYGDMCLFAVGRLDADTEGLLILTNDGEISEKIARPDSEMTKMYYAEFDRPLCENAADIMASGVKTQTGGCFRPAKLEPVDEKSAYITVTEGKYHEVRRLVNACGAYVAYLKRVSIGDLTLDASLAPGEYRELTDDEIMRIKK